MIRKDRLLALDGLRGIAALLVFGGHLESLVLANSQSWLSRSTLCVDFFFVLSGFVISRTYEEKFLLGMTFRQYSWIRLRRLYPLISVGTVIGCVAFMFAGDQVVPPLTRLPSQLLFIPSLWTSGEVFALNNSQWSLLVELVINAAHKISARWLSTRRIVLGVGCLAVLLFFLAYHHGNANLGWDRDTFLGGFVRGGFGFLTGVLFFRLTATADLQFFKLNWLILAIILPVVVAVSSYFGAPAYWYIEPIIVVFLMPIICLAGIYCNLPSWLKNSATFLGSMSYPIYAAHLPILYFAKYIGTSLPTHFVSNVSLATLWITVTLCTSWLLMVLLDNPVQIWLLQKRPQRG
jgi:peptidoglycan/LPS O-acetylase OafA/YrhL